MIHTITTKVYYRDSLPEEIEVVADRMSLIDGDYQFYNGGEVVFVIPRSELHFIKVRPEEK